MKMTPDAIDKDILEYVANDEPWHIICGEMYDEFDSPEELIDRIFNLFDEGLVSISKGYKTQFEPTPELFKQEAEANNWFKDINNTNGLWWDIRTTDKGFKFVKDRFK